MPIILAVLLLEKVKKIRLVFLKIMPKLMLAQSISAYFQDGYAPGGGGGTPIQHLYGYVPPNGVVILNHLI